MIRLDVKQGTEKWLDARLGIPTASCFDKIITPKTLKPGKADAYLTELLAEWVLGEPLDGGESIEMMRGTAAEKSARAWYELREDVDVEEAGLLLTDDRTAGYSPDGLVGDDGLVEIKCPMMKGHIGYLLMEDPSLAHRGQIQGGLWVTGRNWLDLVVWHPLAPSLVHRCYPDPEWVSAFEPALDAFLERLEQGKETLRAKGVDR